MKFPRFCQWERHICIILFESPSYCSELLRTHPVQKYVLQMLPLPENRDCDAGSSACSCMLLCEFKPPFLFLLKDPKDHHSSRYHHHVNSQSWESLQQPQNDLASPQQVQATDWKRKQSIFQVRIKCLKSSQRTDQLYCTCLCVLIVGFMLFSDSLLFRRKRGCPRTGILNSKTSVESCRTASV